MPLSVVRGRRRPGARWSRRDRLALLALQEYEADLCRGCGQPRAYAMDDDAQRDYQVHSGTCHACAALERADRGNDTRPPGRTRWVSPQPQMHYAMHYPLHVRPYRTD